MESNDGRGIAGETGLAKAESAVIDEKSGKAIAGVDTGPPEETGRGAERPLKKAGFIVNDTIASAREQAHSFARLLTSNGVHVVESHSASPENTARWKQSDCLDLIFSFGGDGTILRAARTAAPLGVPLVGVNLGRVGFLTELNPWQLQERLSLFLEGSYWVEKRTMLLTELWRGDEKVAAFTALNDVVASRAALSRVVDCTLSVNGHSVTHYVADGVIVATPTGSTAYSMAAGGPILHPELRSIVVTPIAPYLTIVKSLVLPDDNKIDLHVETDDETYLTIDGQTHMALQDGDTLSITTSPYPCLFARVQDRAYFTATLVNRLRRAE
ncbi:MAG: NAD(+)/NADH kinase [Chloroflexi bacterium]|nr:NAD(+)/NADH kinase [Chloroflexota bacterium]